MQDALIKLLVLHPFYGALASVMSIQESNAVKKTEMSLLPSPSLKYNRKWYEELPDAQAVGALMHELLHLLLLHSLRQGGRDPLLWAVCCDMAVNDHIPGAMLTDSAVTTERIELKIKYKLERMRSAEYYYDKLSNLLDDSISLLEREGAVTLPSVNGSLLEADIQEENEEDINYVDEAALKNKLDEIVGIAKRNGEVPPELLHEFTISPKRSKMDWQNMFRRFLSGMGRMQIRATYKRDSRRFEGFPGHKRNIGLKVLIALDESGSISDEQLDIFFNEPMSINRIPGAEVLVTEFDTECSDPKPAGIYLHHRGRNKQGGTDFCPIFKLAEKLRIFSVVIFTDGNGNAPTEVNQRVLWILTHDGKQPAPFGYSVKFED
jgi:predicted metal-dependent peptidase